MTLDDFNHKYKYMSDKEKYNTTLDVWEIPKPSEDGYIYSDCESYCRFLKNNIEKFKEWDYYYCKLNGTNGHCVLSNGAVIIDCNERKTILKDKFIEKYKVTDFKKYSKFVVFSKILFTKAFLLYRSIYAKLVK